MELESQTRSKRYAIWIVVAFAVVAPLLCYSAYRAVQGKANKVEDWLPKSYQETDDLVWFRQHFTGDQFVLVSWDGCRLGDEPGLPNGEPDDPRIERLARYLIPNTTSTTEPTLDSIPVPTAGSNISPNRSNKRFFKSVTTARHLLDQLTSEPTNLRYGQAINRLRGTLIGPDGRQSCVVVQLSDDAVLNLREVVGHGIKGWLRFAHTEGELQAALRACDIDPDTAYFGGPPIDAVAIDEEGEKSLYQLAVLAALVGLLLAWWSLRSTSLTLIVFACGALSAIASLSVVWLTGGTTDAFLLSMPSLIYVLAISGAVHLIKYYRDAVHKQGLIGAPAQAISQGWKPTLLCSVTTAIGLLALCTSDLTPIRKFGMYSSAGVMLMLVMLFVFLPAALSLWPIHRTPDRGTEAKGGNVFSSDRAFLWLDRFWQRFGGGIIKHYVAVTVGCVVLIASVGFGVTRIHSNVDIMKLFNGQARIRQDYRWLEHNVGRLVPIEIVLKFDGNALRRGDDSNVDQARYSLLQRAETVADVKRLIEAKFGASGKDVIGRAISLFTFTAPLPKKTKSFRNVVRRSVFNTKLEQDYDRLCETGYLATDADGAELWRISVRVAAFKDVDYAEFTNQMRGVVDPIVENHNTQLFTGVLGPSDVAQNNSDAEPCLSVVYTGVIPIIYKAQRALLDSLMESTFWSFITITPLLMLVSRGVLSGSVAMLPNTLPVLVVFGGMGWLGVSVTIGSMMSASIALGVAVDDTIHYLVWYRDELTHTSDRRKASLTAYRKCATPTLQAALISGLGLSVFGFSNFTPTRQFGLLMLTILLAGVVAELVLLPALLAGPLGRAFHPRKKLPREKIQSADENQSKPGEPLESDQIKGQSSENREHESTAHGVDTNCKTGIGPSMDEDVLQAARRRNQP